MTRNCFVAAIFITFFVQLSAFSQSEELPKFELAAEFSTLEPSSITGQRTELGLGGRFTFNLNRAFSLETAGYFFPRRCHDCFQDGRVIEVFGGVKAGKRFQRWGLFAKARPGVVTFTEGEFNLAQPTAGFISRIDRNPLSSFATDVGAVIEFYPSKRIVTRFDAGDTIIHFRRRTINLFPFNSTTPVPITIPSSTTHNFQFMASVGFRF